MVCFKWNAQSRMCLQNVHIEMPDIQGKKINLEVIIKFHVAVFSQIKTVQATENYQWIESGRQFLSSIKGVKQTVFFLQFIELSCDRSSWFLVFVTASPCRRNFFFIQGKKFG